MNFTIEMLNDCVAFLQKNGMENPAVGIVLGTGLNSIINKIEIQQSIPYNKIPHFPAATVESHKGNLVFGLLGNVPVLAMQGRFHYYERYTMQQITFPIRVMKALGVKYLLLSNAAGGLNPDFKKEELVLLTDHINLQPDNPLRGVSDPLFGNRFVDMSNPYNNFLNEMIVKAAKKIAVQIKQGVYVAVLGPNLETRAEYRYLKNIGADMVGMSTVPEVIVANQIGLPCAAVSVITDECNPDDLKPVDIAEIIAVAGRADKVLSTVFAETIRSLI